MKKIQDHYALAIVDMQNDFVLTDAPFCIAGAFNTIPRIQEALEAFRRAQWPVFHIVREHRDDGNDVESIRAESFLKKTLVIQHLRKMFLNWIVDENVVKLLAKEVGCLFP